MPPDLSIVIPAFDEEARLPGSLEALGLFLASREGSPEILVIDDGSSDRTGEVARAADTRGVPLRVLRHEPNRGKGYAVKRGLLEARAGRALVTDADLSTPAEMLDRLEAALEGRGLDLAMGSRALPGSDVAHPQTWVRQTMGKTFNRILRAATGLPFRDTQCGFKLLRMRTMRIVVESLSVDRFAWDAELCLLAHGSGLRVEEVPVVWRNSPESKVSLLSDPLEMLRQVWQVRRRWARGGYPALQGQGEEQ
jgi:glycosyltransferase involved in cell wall biosynthesis